MRLFVFKDYMKSVYLEQLVRYQCFKCEVIFMQKFFLDKYLFIYCFIFQFCKVCNKTFVNVYRLQRYMISYDESIDLRKFKCFECGKVFKFKYYLKEYIRIYSGEKFFECLNCYKRFSYFGFYSSYMIFKKCWVVGLKVYINE